MREHRLRHTELSTVQRLRANCRALTHRLIEKGLLVKGGCEDGAAGTCRGPIEAHHDDYAKPREVRWKCRGHHRQYHRQQAAP